MPEAHEPAAEDYGAGSPGSDEHLAETVVDQEAARTYIGTDTPNDNDYGFSQNEGETEVRSEVYGSADSDFQLDDEAAYTPAEPTELYSASSAEGDSEYNEDFLTDSLQPVEPEVIAEDGIDDPIGINRFDAHEASQLTDGPYYYDLTISGLDTGQIKDEVMKALSDKRFQWSNEDIRRRLRNGALVFKNLNPVKAVLVVIKLQHIDVDIEWVQKLHTDPSVAGGTPRV